MNDTMMPHPLHHESELTLEQIAFELRGGNYHAETKNGAVFMYKEKINPENSVDSFRFARFQKHDDVTVEDFGNYYKLTLNN